MWVYNFHLLLSRVRQVIDNPKLAWYYIQGNINWFLHGKAIIKYVKKLQECPECFTNQECLNCGCNFNRLALSDKKCHKIEEDVHV